MLPGQHALNVASMGVCVQGFGMVNFVDAKYVKAHLNDGLTKVVNVLSETDYGKKHIPGSLNAPVETPGFESRIKELVPDKDQPVIVHCSSNDCLASTKASKKLEELGYTQVYEFKPGIQGWDEAGNAFEGSEAGRAPAEPATRPARPARSQERESPSERPSRGAKRERSQERQSQAPRT